MDDEPASTDEGGVLIDNCSRQKMKQQGWANNKKEKTNPKRQPDPLFECDMAFDKTRSYTEDHFSNLRAGHLVCTPYCGSHDPDRPSVV